MIIPPSPCSTPASGFGRYSLYFIIFLTLLLTVITPLSAPAQEESTALIKKVIIEGNRLIEEETIRIRIQTAEGFLFDPEIISEDIRSIYNLGYFEDVKVDASGFEGGLVVTFIVKEKPLITRISFEGNDKIKTDDLKDKTGIKNNSVVDDYEIKRSVEQLTFFLHEKGFYQGSVTHRLEPLSENELELTYVIDEGSKFKITKIEIRGNEIFSDREIRKVMKTKARGLFSVFSGSGVLRSWQLEEDALRILSFLYNNGHLKARVDDPRLEIAKEKNEITVIVNLVEGPRFRVGKLEIPGDEHFTAREILETMETSEGGIFRRDVFAKDVTSVTKLYTDIGYAFCRVESRSYLRDETNEVDLALIVVRGPKVKVGRISITGNKVTRDNVIRRQVTLKEGESFSSKKLSQSRQKIMNLGFFDKVEINTEPRKEDVVDINIVVMERLTGTITFGVGYSSEDKLGGIVKVTQDNLFGRGQKIQVAAEYSQEKTEYNIMFTDPAVLDSPYSLSMKVYDQTKDYDEYDRDSRGGQLGFGRSLGEYFRVYLTYKNEAINIYNIDDSASSIIMEQEGRDTTHSLTARLVRDSRDNYYNPTRGSRNEIRTEYAGGFLGGENEFTKYELESIFYFPLWWKVVFSIHGEFGVVEATGDKEVPIYERFFLGGINSVRGFESRAISPKDENGDSIGGYKMALFNTEIIFPISEEQRLNAVLFFDAGQAYDDGVDIDLGDVRTSVGAGIRWLSPMGPFRLEWGYNLDPEDDEPTSQWQFSVGTAF